MRRNSYRVDFEDIEEGDEIVFLSSKRPFPIPRRGRVLGKSESIVAVRVTDQHRERLLRSFWMTYRVRRIEREEV